ncbi:MAG: hypothetical protein KDI13_02810 [Alphaproteobacteria bacterium]|nr:hypothetical protein [Alphaproteobacteria bacterium]
MIWLAYAGLVVIGAVGIHIFGKLGAGILDPFLALTIALGSAFAISLATLTATGKLSPSSIQAQTFSPKGVLIAAAMGIAIAFAHGAILYMYRADAPLSLAVPIVRMGAAVIAVILGVLFFQERLSITHTIGIAMSIAAVILITR